MNLLSFGIVLLIIGAALIIWGSAVLTMRHDIALKVYALISQIIGGCYIFLYGVVLILLEVYGGKI